SHPDHPGQRQRIRSHRADRGPGTEADARTSRTDRRHSHGHQHRGTRHVGHGGGPMTIRLLIVEDHAVVRQSLRFLLDQEPDIDVVGEAATAAAALSLAAEIQPDVVLLDLFLPDQDGIAVLKHLRANWAAIHVVVLTSAADDAHLLAAMQAGATSYLQK